MKTLLQRGLIGLVSLLVTLSGQLTNAADPSDLVVLLHPKMKDWEKPIANATSADKSHNWGVYAYHPMKRSYLSDSPVRLEVGDSIKKVEDWTMLIQFGAPGPAVPPAGGAGVRVPFIVHYRPSADVKPVEVARGEVNSAGRDYANAVDSIFQARIRGIMESLTHSEGKRVIADKPTYANSSGIPYTFAPVTLDLKAKPPTASVRLHNKFPVPIGLFLDFQGKFTLQNQDQYFSAGFNERGEPSPYPLEAGEKKTFTIELKDLKPGNEPRWCKLIGLYLFNPTEPPKK